MNEIMWRKSAYSSSNGGNCVEVGQATRTVAVRDTKQDGRGPMLRFTPTAWRRFTDQVKRSLEGNRATERPAPQLSGAKHSRGTYTSYAYGMSLLSLDYDQVFGEDTTRARFSGQDSALTMTS